LGAYTCQDLPFELLVEQLRPERTLKHAPIFQVKFLLQHRQEPLEGAMDLALSGVEMARATTELDLVWDLAETEGVLIGYVDYRTDLFDAPTIKSMARHYQTLLAGIVTEPWRRLSELRLLTAEETGSLAGADFSAAELSRQELENLIIELSLDAAGQEQPCHPG
jgi:non-ribosomal peptide synthetase component F